MDGSKSPYPHNPAMRPVSSLGRKFSGVSYDPKATGLRLRLARKSKSWSQQVAADLAGISLSTLKRAETEGPLSIYVIDALCGAYRVDPCWIMHGKGEKDQHSTVDC